MRQWLFWGCCVLYLVGSTLNAQIGTTSKSKVPSGVVTGFISDLNSEQPLAAVNVLIQDINLGDATSLDGRYIIRNVPVGAHTLVISRIGHQSVKREFSISMGQNVILDFQLTVLAVLFDEIIVERTSLIGNKDRLFKIPGSAHYLGSKDLAEFEYNDIHRVLQAIPGINIQEEDGYGLRPNIGFRGTGSERSSKITIMEDGILQAPAPYSAPAAYYFPTVGRMSAIEVRKGSSQIKYGPFTTGGALNLISTAIPQQFDGYVELFAGPDEYRRIHATAGNSSKNFGFLAETFQAKTDGFKELDSGGNTGFDKKDYVLKFRFNTNPTATVYQQLTFKFTQTDETSNETYLGLTDADFESNPLRRYAASQNDVINTEQTQLVIRHFIKPTQSLDFTSSFYRTDFQRNWYKLDRIRAIQEGSRARIADVLADPLTFASEYSIATGQSSPNDNALEVMANNRKYYAWGFQTQAVLQFKAFSGAQEAEVGIRYHEDQIDRFQWVDLFRMENGIMELTHPGTPGTESNRIGEAQVWAGYVQLNLNFGRLTAVPGIRYETMSLIRDDYGANDPERTGGNLSSRENEVDAFIPGIGFDYRFSPSFSSFFGMHKGFAPPGSREGTQPESSINYEVGTRFNRANFNFQGVFFFNDYSNLLGSDLAASGGEGSGDQFNGGEVDARGLELSFNYDFGARTSTEHIGIPLRVAYTFTDTEFKNTFESEFNPWGKVANGDELPYVPKHQLFASMGLEAHRFGATFGAKYTGQMRTVAGQGDFVDALSTRARIVFDLSANFAITNENQIFVTVRNLFNEKYIAARRPAGARPGLPRTFLAGVKADF